jgi:hypothetical protein
MSRESPTDLLIRVLEEIEGVEDIIIVVKQGDEVTVFTNEPDATDALYILAYAQVIVGSEDEEEV